MASQRKHKSVITIRSMGPLQALANLRFAYRSLYRKSAITRKGPLTRRYISYQKISI